MTKQTWLLYIYIYEDAYGMMVIIIWNGHATHVKILDEAVCVSHNSNTLMKSVNSTILPPTMDR